MYPWSMHLQLQCYLFLVILLAYLAVLGLRCCVDLSQLSESWGSVIALSSCHLWALRCSGFSCCGAQAPKHRLSVVAHNQLPELAQTHVHCVSDAIQPLLSSPSPAFNLSHHQGLFQSVSSLHQVTKVLELQLQHQSFQWIFRVDFL